MTQDIDKLEKERVDFESKQQTQRVAAPQTFVSITDRLDKLIALTQLLVDNQVKAVPPKDVIKP